MKSLYARLMLNYHNGFSLMLGKWKQLCTPGLIYRKYIPYVK